ncbi:ABC transporter substrate-binding protein [Muricoccus radiodurans]|uniref:ABC transporter substrate-binding protein n=1 Tax=Muricoccus radiodurans TaxID=2231721 RepID=UPI003CFA81A9
MLALAAALASCATVVAAQNLTLGTGAQPTSLDPHYHNLGPNMSFSSAVFDNLVMMDARARVVAGLAESWRAVDATTWEFRLRSGVTFHDGTPFTADDVTFTLDRLPTVANSPGSFTLYIRSIIRAEVVDERTVRFTTAGPNPMLPNTLAQVPMIGRRIHSGLRTEDYNAGRGMIGTGPFRFVGGEIAGTLRLARNDAYWGTKPAWATATQRAITNDGARMAALLAGDVDVVDQVPTADVARMRGNPRLALADAVSLRSLFIVFDFSRQGATPFVTDNTGRPIDPSPLRDVRVRRALSAAIDRQAIVDRVMEGGAIPTVQYMAPGNYGYAPDLEPRPADLAEARRLLAEAGFPEGFRLTLHGPNDRYPNDARIIQAIGQMWTRAGIRTAVEASPYASFINRASRQEFSVFLGAWGASTGEPATSLTATIATYDPRRGTGTINRGRHSDPALDAAIAEAALIADDREREERLQAVTRQAMERQPIIPLLIVRNTWAMRAGLRMEGRADERTRPQDVSPATP